MAYTEQAQSRHVEITERATIGQRVWHCEYDEVFTDPLAPSYGKSFDPGHPQFKYLLCNHITLDPIGTPKSGTGPRYHCSHWSVTADYSTLTLWSTRNRAKCRMRTQALDIQRGGRWEDGSAIPDDVPVYKIIPCIEYSLEIRPHVAYNAAYESFPFQLMLEYGGCVNAETIMGWPPETVLFESVEGDSAWDFSVQQYTANLEVHFLMRPKLNGIAQGHNMFWDDGQWKRPAKDYLPHRVVSFQPILDMISSGSW